MENFLGHAFDDLKVREEHVVLGFLLAVSGSCSGAWAP
jgi:hypothetical protein